MKKIVISVLLALTSNLLFSQQQSDPLLFMQGLEQNGNQFFQIGNYIFNLVNIDKEYNEKEINKVLKKYDIKNLQKRYSDQSIDSENTVAEYEAKNKELTDLATFHKSYFFPTGKKKMRHITMQVIMPRDSLLEKSFMDAYFSNSLNKYIVCYTYSTRKLNFLGREIKLGASCNWMFVNNLQCPGNGQMNWSIYPTLEEAQKGARLQMRRNSERKILKNEELNIIFEGEPVIATRIVYKMGVPRIIMGGSNNLAVFYVTSKVRGQCVSCVLSNYVENENDYTLGALLQEVMELTE